jgi:hypothetical protein
MGVSVEFLFGSPDGIEGHFLSGPLEEFQEWYHQSFEEFSGEKKDPRVAMLIENILLQGHTALSVTTLEQAVVMDKMMHYYYGTFCNSVCLNQTVLAFEGWVKVSGLEPLRDILKVHCGSKALRYLTYLFDGRGVGRNHEVIAYQPVDDVFRLGYWTATEVEDFLQCLSRDAIPASSTGSDYNIILSLQNAQAKKTGIIIVVA